ncbi:MAG: NmrA family NAD(P)-binding protein [Acidobacteriota bacterium]|nr:NmrA family NAD(P)-binding protein [Acidobacteriota bacterium]
MKQTILVAGGTGNLGELIVKALIKRGAEVRAITRKETDSEKTEKLKKLGAEVISVDMWNAEELKRACQGVSCVVSALSGLHETIVDAQSQLLDAAIAAGVPRFIPSDFAADFTRLPEGDNRNFDLRKEFHKYLDKSPIAATSIMNGAFSYVLSYNTPLFDLKNYSVGYWGNDPDWKIDFSTMDNTADYTAAAALDSETPRVLRIASFQVSPKDLAAIGEEVKKEEFKLVPMGSLEDFSAANKKDRATHPEGETEVFPDWQAKQYLHSMFSVHNETLDNDHYPDVQWTSAINVVSKI